MTSEVSDFLAWISSEKGLSQHTKTAYEKDLDQFLLFCQLYKIDFKSATLGDLRKFVAHVRRLNRTERTIARKSSALKQFYKFLLRENQIGADPSALLNIVVKSKKLPKHLTEAEMGMLLHSASGATEAGIRDRAILEFWYATGCRISELCQVTVKDIDWEGQTVKLFGKGMRERMVPLTQDAILWCKKYKDIRHEWLRRNALRETEVFFLSLRGKKFTRQGLWKLLKRYVKASGITRKVWPHMIRHSVATHVLRGGADLRAVQELLGHQSITTTEVYTHLDIENLKNMQSKFHPRN